MYSLDTLPYKTLIKVFETKDSSILGDNHVELWEKLSNEYKETYNVSENTRILDLVKRISVLELKQKILALVIEGLKFDNDKEYLDILKNIGYTFDAENYESELNRLDVSIKSLNPKIANIKAKLPKETKKTNIDEVIISYCSILGVTYDTNLVTVTQFHGLQNNVESKIKSLNAK